MSDLISRQAAIDEIRKCRFVVDAIEKIRGLPSAQPEIIHCKDCRWWEKYGDNIGYCHAAKHGHISRHWEISIMRTYESDFFCADAERRQDG